MSTWFLDSELSTCFLLIFRFLLVGRVDLHYELKMYSNKYACQHKIEIVLAYIITTHDYILYTNSNFLAWILCQSLKQ